MTFNSIVLTNNGVYCLGVSLRIRIEIRDVRYVT